MAPINKSQVKERPKIRRCEGRLVRSGADTCSLPSSQSLNFFLVLFRLFKIFLWLLPLGILFLFRPLIDETRMVWSTFDELRFFLLSLNCKNTIVYRLTKFI